jgi:hypothetical protein
MPAGSAPASARRCVRQVLQPWAAEGSDAAEFAEVMDAERTSDRDALIIADLLKKE